MRLPKLCKNGDGRAFVIIPGSGRKRRYFGKWGSPEAEDGYRDWINQYLTAPLDRQAKHSKHGNIASLTAEYFGHLKESASKSVVSTARTALLSFNEMAWNRSVHDIGPRLLSEYREKLISSTYTKGHKKPKRYSSKTMNDHLKAIRRMVKWACRMEYLAPEVYAGLAVVEGVKTAQGRETDPVKPVPWSEVQKTLPYLPETVAVMVQIQFLCGMRPGEVRKMRIQDVDTSGDVWLYCPAKHKNTHRKHTLTKAIPGVAQPLLRPFLANDESGCLFDPKVATRAARASHGATDMTIDSEVPGQPGDCYAATSYLQAVRRGIDKARKDDIEVMDWTPAMLRHSIGTLIRQQLGQQAAQVYLGHADLDTTGIYAERTVKELGAVARQIDGHLAGLLLG